jgi:hypothetical protein
LGRGEDEKRGRWEHEKCVLALQLRNFKYQDANNLIPCLCNGILKKNNKRRRKMAKITIEPEDAQNVKSLVRIALQNELKVLKTGIARTQKKLEELETKHHMSSEQFYARFKRGEMGDDFQYIRWAGEYETLQQLRRDHDDLSRTELCS